MFLFSYLCRVPPLELSWPNRPMPLSHPTTMQLLPMSSRNRFCSYSDSAQLNHIILLADATVPIVDLGDVVEDELGCSPSAHPKTTAWEVWAFGSLIRQGTVAMLKIPWGFLLGLL